MANQPVRIFISYSHKDEELREELEGQLAILKNLQKIRIWQDRQIKAGDEWNDKILKAIDAADIIVLLVSPRFMASNFCFNKEMPRAMKRHQQGTAKVIPVILSPCPWKQAPFARLGVLPTDGKPVTEWTNRDAAFHNVAEGITKVVNARYGPEEPEDDGWGTDPVPTGDGWDTDPPFGDEPQPTRASSTQAGRGRRSRLELVKALSQLPGPQFSQLMFVIDPPSGIVPGSSAPQATRVEALLEWAKNDPYHSIEEVENTLDEIIGNPR
jgi:hypothetical protein